MGKINLFNTHPFSILLFQHYLYLYSFLLLLISILFILPLKKSECNYKSLNLKKNQTVELDNESSYCDEIQNIGQCDKIMNIQSFTPDKNTLLLFNDNHNNLNESPSKNSINYDHTLSNSSIYPQMKKKNANLFQNKLTASHKVANIKQIASSISFGEQSIQLLEKKVSVNNQAKEGQDLSVIQKTQIPQKKIPVRLMKAINLLVNVKAFYRQLAKNSRIFEKITQKQQQLIGDITAKYKKHYGSNVEQFLKNSYLSLAYMIFNKIQSFLKWIFLNMILFQPNQSAKRLWDVIQAISILYFIYVISLVIFFSLKINDYESIFSMGFILFLIDMIFTFNTAIIEKGNVITQRNKIAVKYLKGNFFFDILGLIPFLVTYFNLTLMSEISSKFAYSFIIFKIFLLLDILDSLSFFFSFQQNKKNLVDLFKVIFLIVSVCHIFSVFWHGLALYEITVLERDDTWINSQNLLDADVYIRYIYSFYFLAVTMQTVGYGDITPKNPIEIMFTIITMFCTSMIWAFSLNSIGNIMENINKGNKDYKNDMELIHCFMRDEVIDSNLKVKVSNYLEYLYKESNEAKKKREKEIICKLSKQLQLDLACKVQGKFLKDIPILRDFVSEKNQLKLIPFMEEILFSPGENIFKQYEVDDSAVYYIVKGSVQLLFESKSNDKKEHIFQELFKKQYFGEISFITGQVRGATARASDFCRLFKIKREQFIEIIKNDMNDYENLQMVKEAITLKNNLKFASIRCFQCNQGDHLSIKCPKTQLTLAKQITIQKHNFSVPIKERIFQKRRIQKKQFQSRLKLSDIQEVIFNINNNPEYEQQLIEIENNFLKPDEEMDQYPTSSEQQSNSESDSESSNSQCSINSSSQNSEKDVTGTQATSNRPSIIINDKRKSSIFARRHSQKQIGSFLDIKPSQTKEKITLNNLNPSISIQNVSEVDIDSNKYTNKKRQSTNYAGGSQTQLSVEPQQLSFPDNNNRRQSHRRKSSFRQEDLYQINLNQVSQKQSQNDDAHFFEHRKSFSSQNSQMIDKYSKKKEKKVNSLSSIGNISAKEKEKDRNNCRDSSQKILSHLNQNNKINIQRKSLPYTQIQNLVTFQLSNNIAQSGNQKDLHQQNIQANNFHFNYSKQFSYGSAHNLNKLYNSQTTQNDQRNCNYITIEEMNKRFDKLFNFKVYYPHNNSTAILENYEIIIKQNIDKLYSKTIYRHSNHNNNSRKFQKKGIQSKNVIGFSKDIISKPNIKQSFDFGNSNLNSSQIFGKKQGQSLKDLQKIKEH